MDDEPLFRPSINISLPNLPSALHNSTEEFTLTPYPSSPSKFNTTHLPSRVWWKPLSPIEERKDREEMTEGEGLLEQMEEARGGEREERKRKIFLTLEIVGLCVLVVFLMGLIAFCLRTGGRGMLSEYIPLT